MKMVIYKRCGNYTVTTLKNYKSYIQDTRKIQDCSAFNSAEEIIDYYCKYFHSKPEDFTVIC